MKELEAPTEAETIPDEAGVSPEEQPEAQRSLQQRIMDKTGGVVTVPNMVSLAAIAGAFAATPYLDSVKGYVGSMAAFEADQIDGWWARRFGVESKVGEVLDHIGDKIKFLPALYHTWNLDMAPKTLLAAIAVQQAATGAVTVADRVMHGKDHRIKGVDKGSRRAFYAMSWGLGIAIGGELLSRRHPEAGQAVKLAGAAISWAGVVWGAERSVHYARKVAE